MTGYVLGSGSVAALAVVALLPFAPSDPTTLGWAAAGWVVAAVAGTWAGARLVGLHGLPGHGFLVSFFVLMAARLLVYAAGLVAAGTVGLRAVVAYLVGAAVAHATTQGFEWIWFARKTA